jgi:hypothetical protein
MAGPPDPHAVSAEFRDQAVPVFWGHHRLDRGCGLAEDLHFFFQIADPAAGSGKLGGFLRRRARLQATVDQIPVPPSVQA